MSAIAAEFFANTRPVDQLRLDWLTRQGVPPLALSRDPGQFGFIIGVADIHFQTGGFAFGQPDTCGLPALVFIARDVAGDPCDLVAWAPRTDQVAAMNGRAVLLGAQEILAPRLSRSLPVHSGPLAWLRADRTGVVVVDRRRAWRLLDDVTVAAESVEHGLELRKILSPPMPRIVVPAALERPAA